MFNIIVSKTDSGIEYSVSKFADDTMLCGVVKMLEGSNAIQRDLDRLEKWVRVKLVKLNKAKCKVLQVGWGNPNQKHRLAEEWIENSLEEKDLGLLVDKTLDVSQ